MGEWHEAHPWSPFRLFGYDLWRLVYEDPHGLHMMTERGRSKKVAHEMLKSMYDPTPPIGSFDLRTGRVFNGTEWV